MLPLPGTVTSEGSYGSLTKNVKKESILGVTVAGRGANTQITPIDI